MTARLRPAALLLTLVAFAACDSAVGGASSFTARLTGAVDAQLRGDATFSPGVAVGASRVTILLSAREDRGDGTRGSILFDVPEEALDREGVLRAGTYTVGDGLEAGVSVWGTLGPVSLAVQRGTLTLTASSLERLQGTFDLEARAPWGAASAVQGMFTAVAE